MGGARIESSSFRDIGEMSAALRGLDSKLWLVGRQLEPEWSVFNLGLDHSRVATGNMAGAFGAAAVAANLACIVLRMDDGAPWRYNGSAFDHTQALVIGAHAEYAVTGGGASKWMMLQVPHETLREETEAINGPLRARERSVTALTPSEGAIGALRRVMGIALQHARAKPEVLETPGARRALEQHIRLASARCVASPARALNVNCTHAARMAIRYLDDHENEPVYLSELCVATHLSERALRRAFQTTYGLSPMRLLQVRRLNQVRRALLTESADPQVTEVAMRHGFFDLGRFAAAYREVFGELPSTTLRKR